MTFNKVILQIIVFSILVFNFENVLSYENIKQADFHTHGLPAPPSRPCGECSGGARCVPLVQCPAHLRARTEVCHAAGRLPAVCCEQILRHAAESDLKLRAATPLSKEITQSTFTESQKRLSSWLHRLSRLRESPELLIVNETSPSYAHHLSTRSTDHLVVELRYGGLRNMFATEYLKSREAIDEDQLALGLTEHTDAPFCPPLPKCSGALRYRTVGGECNNPSSPSWGAVNTGYERLLPPDYSDGIWSMRMSASKNPLPSARQVSISLLLDGSHHSATHNLMFMQFGQFIAHDVTAGVVYTMDNGDGISCCTSNGDDVLPPDKLHPACAPLTIASDDPFYGQFQQRCLNFVRTTVVGNSDCTLGHAKQMNGATHFLDLSQVYGNNRKKLSTMRAPGGLMKTFNDFGRHLPPQANSSECVTLNKGAACFDSGDNHGNQVISLTILHTIWTREHNRVARELFRLNPKWDDDTVFMEARRIVQAEFQHIIYNEWLPLLLGTDILAAFDLPPSLGYSSSYDPKVHPSITAEFATAAMRFGHSVVDATILVPKPRSNSVYEVVSLPEVMFAPARLRLRPYLDRMLMGLALQPMQRVDPYVTEALTRYMFHGGHPFGLDLAAINIQRGRDHGIRSYNEYRRLVGLQPVTDFHQMMPNVAQRLSSVYESPEDIDLWVGGLLEEPVGGGVIGATFANIVADQFARLKIGDRYFYEHGPDVNPGAFSPSELEEIKKVTLSRIICDNSDRIELVSQPPNAFLRSDLLGNEPVPCDSHYIPSIDLTRFKKM